MTRRRGDLFILQKPMSWAKRLHQLRSGFHRTFWIANTLELFERFAFYGAKAVLAVYLAEKVALGPQLAASLVGAFSGVLYFLPVLAGTLVDRYGFRRTLAACFAIFTVGYFLIGLAGLEFGQSIVQSVGRTPYVVAVLLLTAVGGSLIKPCIVGTVASTSIDETRSLGFSIYYTLVNIGGALGPVLALQVRENLGIEYVLIMSSVTSFALFLGTLFFFEEPPAREERTVRTMAAVLRDMLVVFTNLRFMLFLIIASGFYILFWQIFYSFPFYVKEILHYERFELLETVDAWAIILLTVPATAIVKGWKPIRAITLGFFIASVAWLMIPLAPTVPVCIVAMALFAAGEATFAPRFYEYIATLAPPDQVGTFMGFAFLPVSVGSFVAGPLAGWLVANYVRGAHPNTMWYVLSGIGLASTASMVIYNAVVGRKV
jgi:proton-dependent oligopeptide transporter, POT family